MDIFDAGKKAIDAAKDFSKDCSKQTNDYYKQYVKPDEIAAPEKDWNRDVKELEDLIDTMEKAGEFWHGDVVSALPGYGSGNNTAINQAKTLLKTIKSKIAAAKK
jgi:hypothetical protein